MLSTQINKTNHKDRICKVKSTINKGVPLINKGLIHNRIMSIYRIHHFNNLLLNKITLTNPNIINKKVFMKILQIQPILLKQKWINYGFSRPFVLLVTSRNNRILWYFSMIITQFVKNASQFILIIFQTNINISNLLNLLFVNVIKAIFQVSV